MARIQSRAMAAPIEIDVWQGEISELEVDALVVPANESLFMTAAVAASVKRHAGEDVERAAVAQGPVSAGTAVVTHGGPMATPYVIHAVAVGHDRRPDPAILRSAVDAALAFAHPLQLHRMAFASLGTEHGAFTPHEAAAVIVAAVLEHAAVEPLPDTVVLATVSPTEARAFAVALDRARVEAR